VRKPENQQGDAKPAREIEKRHTVIRTAGLPLPIPQKIGGQRVDYEIECSHHRGAEDDSKPQLPHIQKQDHPSTGNYQGHAEQHGGQYRRVPILSEWISGDNSDGFREETNCRRQSDGTPVGPLASNGNRCCQREKYGRGPGHVGGRAPGNCVAPHAAEPQEQVSPPEQAA